MKRTLLSLALAASAALSASALANSNSYTLCSTSGCSSAGSSSVSGSYAQTKYPIILAHGLAGTGGIGYFYGIPSDLASNGAKVYVTQVAAFNNVEVRGEELLAQTKTILAITGAAKVNFMAHSQGALDTRYVAAVIPGNVASLSTVGGVNHGSSLADAVSGLTNIPGVGTLAGAVLSSIVNAYATFASLTYGLSYEQNSLAAMKQLSTAGVNAFNASYPAGLPTSSCGNGPASAKGIAFYSWSGTGHFTNILDPTDPALALTGLAFGGNANDGAVGQCASHLGTVIRDNYNMNHLDEVNQIYGLVSIFETSPVTLFRNQANRLKVAGF